jgi:hypothetical protein
MGSIGFNCAKGGKIQEKGANGLYVCRGTERCQYRKSDGGRKFCRITPIVEKAFLAEIAQGKDTVN